MGACNQHQNGCVILTPRWSPVAEVHVELGGLCLAAGLRGEVTSAKIDSQIVAASNFVGTIKFMYRAMEILAGYGGQYNAV